MSNEASKWAYAQTLAIPDERARADTKFVLTTLAYHYNGRTGRCDPSIERLMADTGCSRSTIFRCLRRLQDVGLINKERGYGDRRTDYFLAFEGALRYSKKSQIRVQIVSKQAINEGEDSVKTQEDSVKTQEDSVKTQPTSLYKQEETGIEPEDPRARELSTADFAATIQSYENNIGLLTPTVSQEIQHALDEVPASWIIEAIAEAAIQNKRSWAYVWGILKRWIAEGRGEKERLPPEIDYSDPTLPYSAHSLIDLRGPNGREATSPRSTSRGKRPGRRFTVV